MRSPTPGREQDVYKRQAATKAHDAAEALADAAPERQCAAMTKAGTRCKRDAIDGSDYCSIHQIA